METVKRILKENLSHNDTVFIFPSEITASFWRRKSLEISDRKAVLSSRFISWDKFKEDFFSLNQRGLPVNSIMRNLFAVSLLEENREKEFFRYIIPPEYKSNSGSFRRLLVSVLPKLPKIAEDIRAGSLKIPRLMAEDFLYLQKRYSEFLERSGLFEPGWMNAGIGRMSGVYYLFFPEVIIDYNEFSLELTKVKDFRPVSLDSCRSRDIVKFSSSAAEIKWLLKKIDRLLDDGVEARDIVITAADMDGWRDKLETAAALRSIPLSFHGGLPLSSYPGASFFKSVGMCYSSGFSSSAVKQLFLNGMLPWKEDFPAGELVSFGIKYGCFVNYRRNNREVDLWADKLGKRGQHELLGAYRRIKNSIAAVNMASTFASLKTGVQRFISDFMDTGKWEDTGIVREFQFALDLLNSIAEAEKRCAGVRIPSPFDFWITAMDEKIYVPKDSGGGIPVYPYRVAGGIDVKWHFISGFSQRVSAVEKEDYPFLREDQKRRMSSSKHDFTGDFLSLYSLSGENVVFSMSSDSFSGPEIPPTDFVGRSAVKTYVPDPAGTGDMYDTEVYFWKGAADMPERVSEIMVQGLENALATILSGKRIDYTATHEKDPELRKEFFKRVSGESDILEVSPTMLDSFYACPYAFFLNNVLGVGNSEYSMNFRDHMLIGNIIHTSFRELFSYINRVSGFFDPSGVNSYREESIHIVDKVFSEFENRGEDMFPLVWEETRTFVKEHIVAFLEVEAEKFPLFRMDYAEKEFSSFLEDGGIKLKGKVDRISSSAGGRRCIVDYKKNFRLSLESLNPAEGLPSSFQLFFYMFLAESYGMKINHVSYYNFTGDKYVDLFSDEGGKKVLGRKEADNRIDEMLVSIKKMKKRITEGDFTVESCESCDMRSVCRKKFTVR